MVQCQCIKDNGQKCTRDVSKKTGHNPLYCWQHQKCKKTAKLHLKSTAQPHEVNIKSPTKCPNFAQWIKDNLFKGGQNTGYEYLPDQFYNELGCTTFGYIQDKTKYMYDFWDVILHISPFPAWIEKPWNLDYIYELMQEDQESIYKLREAFEKDGGHLPYSKEVYTEDDLPSGRE